MNSPLLTLNNGVAMPALGLGVYQSGPEETVDAVAAAIAGGYRLIDTAAAYGNEKQVGEGIVRSGYSGLSRNAAGRFRESRRQARGLMIVPAPM